MILQPTPSTWLWNFLKTYEKFRPTAYPATADERRRGIWTIGWGHTAGVKEGDTCTTDQAQVWLVEDTAVAHAEITRLVTVLLTQNELDALTSLVFNCGDEPLLKTLGHKLNAGDRAGAAAEFPRWDTQGGVVLPGLENRRLAEMAHFALNPGLTSGPTQARLN